MDDAKRQKVMIGVLALLVIGAGGYWFLGRDSGAAPKMSQSAPKERKKRDRDTTEAEKAPKKEGNRKVAQEPAEEEERDEARGNRAKKPADAPEHKGNTKRDAGPAKKKEKKNMPAV